MTNQTDTSITVSVGQPVRARKSIWEAPTGDSPGGLCAKVGDKLIVKKVGPPTLEYHISVAHETRTDGCTFGVAPCEIEPWDLAT